MQSWRHPEGWNELVTVLGIAIFCLATWVFIELADDAPEGDYLETERVIMELFRHDGTGAPIGPHWLPDAVRDLTGMASAIVLIVLALLILGYLCITRRYAAAALVAIATAGGEGLNTLLKDSFERPRPTITSHLVEVKTSSFPSGHSMAASIFYLTMGALLAQTAKRRREKIYIMSAAILLTLLTGVSRVYLGVHYPTDVLAGWSAGAAWAILCWFVARWFDRRGKLKEQPA
jgi:undecaprenyl-diphosphatase